jgi:error-prone DNA polymerase
MIQLVLPVDVNHSFWDNTPEEKDGAYYAVRLGFRQVKGLRGEDMALLITARQQFYTDIDQLRSAGVPEAALEKLCDADTFRSLGSDRRALYSCTINSPVVLKFSVLVAVSPWRLGFLIW